MMSRLREIRKAKGLTLADVAARCDPQTTAVTIGRLETGVRGLSVAWLERLAAALDVEPKQLIAHESDPDIPVAALLGADGPFAATEPLSLHAPVPPPGTIGLLVRASQGEYRAGDMIWLDQLPPERFHEAVNTDILVPRPVGRFLFGRLAAIDSSRLQLLPPKPGGRQAVITDAPWIGRVATLIRRL
jgi:transcriptional regulator with XRE-family HTH domain